MKRTHFTLLTGLLFTSMSYAGGGWSHFTFYVYNRTTQTIYFLPFAPKTMAPRAWSCMTVEKTTSKYIQVRPGIHPGSVNLAFHTIGSCLQGQAEGVYIMRIIHKKSNNQIAQAKVGFNNYSSNQWSVFGIQKNSNYVITTNGSNTFIVSPAS